MSSIKGPQDARRSAAGIPLVAADHAGDGKRHLLLAASGSVATIKIPDIVQGLSRHSKLSIRVLLTASAAQFLRGQSPEQPTLDSLRSVPNVDGIHLDEDEWVQPWIRNDPILHIELRKWADILVIAPLSANTMAKIVGGFSDNLLCSVARAWDTTGEVEGHPGHKKLVVVAPAMNTAMWRHQVTQKHLKVLEGEWGVGHSEGWIEVVRPVEKELACGDVGDGAMRDWTEVVSVIEQRLSLDAAPPVS